MSAGGEKNQFEAKKEKLKTNYLKNTLIHFALILIVYCVLLTDVIVLDSNYNKAIALYNLGQYKDAITAFEALNGYKDSTEQIEICKAAILEQNYNNAIELCNAGQYNEAIAAFEALNGYKDSKEQIETCKTAILEQEYSKAVELSNAGMYMKAIAAFEALDGYKDSTERISGIKHSKEYLRLFGVGDTVQLGNYGKREIDWRILDKQGDSILVISEYGLDVKPYNEEKTDITWEKCTLRKWLNNEFLNSAFSAEELAMIQTTKVTADKNPDYRTNPGNDTEDKVFILSIAEAKKYFASKDDIICYPTDFAVDSGCYKDSRGSCWWWLRSPGCSSSYAAYVNYDGYVNNYGNYVSLSEFAVRPALWINLES